MTERTNRRKVLENDTLCTCPQYSWGPWYGPKSGEKQKVMLLNPISMRDAEQCPVHRTNDKQPVKP
jgi:hypothetical protein